DENPENTPEDIANVSFEHVFPVSDAATEYTVVLTMEHAQCPDTFSQTISIEPRPQPAFTSPEAGCAPLTIDFQNQSTLTDDILLYFWDFGDGTSSVLENPSKTFHNYSGEDKEFTVSLTLVAQNYQCFYSHEEQVLVYPQISAGFTVTPGSSCSQATITITDQASNAEWYFWELGDGSEILVPAAEFTSPFPHDYFNTSDQPDTLLLKQTLWLEREGEVQCIQEHEEELVILPEHAAAIIANGEQMEEEQILEGCSPFTIDLLSEETDSILSRTWYFGDGTSSTLQNPQHTFTNDTQEVMEYAVSLQTFSEWGCQDETQITVRVLPAVTSSFSFSPHTACSPADINFTSTSTGST
ncbi:MAG: hypothetical protein LC655_04175, partial [Bacteroidales bacterium]|nr:hypothetical protein [Bacteroidales bacterium]